MKSARFVCTCAAAALLATAGNVLAGPKQGQLQAGHAAKRLHPLRMAKFTKVNGNIVLTTPWIDVAAAPVVQDTNLQVAFDCYEGDPNSLPDPEQPYNFLTCGNNSTIPGGTPDTRWFFGQTAPAVTRAFNDMTLTSGFNGVDAEELAFAWNAPSGVNQTTVAVATYEDFGTGCNFPATPGFLDGVLFDFGPQTGGAGYFWAHININSGPTPLVLGLPADGVGAYEIEFYSDVAGTLLQSLPGTQPMLWGTGEDELTPDGRKGTQDVNQFDDDVSPFGPPYATGAAPAGECYDYSQPTICPTVLGSMMKFWGKGAAVCYPDCNLSGNLTIADFGCFQAAFVNNLPYADCNNSATFTIADFGCFQAAFVAGCP